MSRVKRGTIANKRRRSVLKQAKGYRFGRSTKEKQAREAILHAGVHAFAARRDKKNVRRREWEVRLNAALDPMGVSYSKFIGALKKATIELDRKILSELAISSPDSFKVIVDRVKA